MDVSARRPPNRTDLRIITLFQNRRGVPQFHDHTARWDESTPGAKLKWIESLQPGDVVQLVPRATYQGWVNFIQTARIIIGYEPTIERPLLRNTPSMGKYIYARPLNSSTKEIRLLDLQPGEAGDPVVCSIRFHTLGSNESFEALSYCWGNANDSSELILYPSETNGRSEAYSTPGSVFMALKQLRYRDRPRSIWIDQLCINQNDIEERAQQVSMMTEIYSNASAVNIWLGDRDPSTEAGMRVVRDIHNFSVRVCKGGDACTCFGTRHTIIPTKISDSVDPTKAPISFRGMYEIFAAHQSRFVTGVRELIGGHLTELMSCIFMNPWFRRIWVLQEALRARTALVYCGPEIISWNELLDVNMWLNSTDYRFQETFLPAHPMMPSIWTTLRTQQSNLASLDPRDSSQQGGHHLGILDVFLDGLELKATDPRDKLFALLPFGRETCISDELPLAIRPSYSKSSKRVLADFTKWWICTNKSLAILSYTHGQPGRAWVRLHDEPFGPQKSKPTWAIGSDGKASWAKTTLNTLFQFTASNDTVPDQSLLDLDTDPDPEVLKLVGFNLATITEITYIALDHNPEEISESSKDLLAVWDQIIDPCGHYKVWNFKAERARENRDDLPVQVERRMFDDRRGIAEFFDHLNAHWAYVLRPNLPAVCLDSLLAADGELKRCETNRILTCLDPFFFLASNGMVGLCPWAARKGDVIVILYGGNVPFLLRPVSSEVEGGDNSKEVKRFELVGECFVSGVMHGEYLRGRNFPESETFILV
ncbi:heterokaryon incompatibility protein [Rutstroemia sp. NJR-2017a BBW]|nr:heterokaryon incompatibility protein [Rutstroemia sp. NJR-2017a BBW]